MSAHAILWMDHHQAQLVQVEKGSFLTKTIEAHDHHGHRHAKDPTRLHEHPHDQLSYFREVAKALKEVNFCLLVGPSTAKSEFRSFLREFDHQLEDRIAAVETADHPTTPQLAARARKYFKIDDRTLT